MSRHSPAMGCSRFLSVVYLFHEGETEFRYFQDISANRLVRITRGSRNAAPVKLLQEAVAFAKRQSAVILRTTPDPHIWVVFDDDEKPDIRNAADWFVENRAAIPEGLRDRFHVGYMKPCIELWGMLCHPKGKTLFRRAKTHVSMQHELSRIMPSYNHDGNPYFDAAAMTEIAFACTTAENWERTSGCFPDCVDTSYFAGIHPLVNTITSSGRVE